MKNGKFLSILIFILISTLTFAQNFGRNFERKREIFETIKIYELTKEVGIDEELGEKFFPIYRKLEELREKQLIELSKLSNEIEKALKIPDKLQREEKLKELIDKVIETRRNFKKKEIELQLKLMDLLTIEQKAKYILFEINFPKKMREAFRRFRHRRRFNK